MCPMNGKFHKAIPIFKSDPTSIKNYYLISLLSNTSKVLEHIIFMTRYINHVSVFISLDSRLIDLPLNSYSYSSTTPFHLKTSLMSFTLKAFYSISHFHLLSKLHHFKISGSLWLWLQAYLSNRFQFVSVNNFYSNILLVVSGVPQGSILGSLLFLLCS